MVDKVRPLKWESTGSGGGDDDDLPTGTDPSEDYLACKGVALEQLDTHLIDRNGDNIQFTDPANGTKSVLQLRTAIQNIFDNSTNGWVSTNVQAAIEEALSVAIGNDSYSFVASYNGNANVGRYLEVFPAIGSDSAPLIFPTDAILTAVSLGVVAVGTGTIGFFKSTDLVTPIYSISITAESRKLDTTVMGAEFDALDELSIRVTSGSFNKPFIRVWGRKVIT